MKSAKYHVVLLGDVALLLFLAKRGICRRRVSVCVSVTLRYCIKTAKRKITQIMPHDKVE